LPELSSPCAHSSSLSCPAGGAEEYYAAEGDPLDGLCDQVQTTAEPSGDTEQRAAE